jgi:hypothetical protein
MAGQDPAYQAKVAQDMGAYDGSFLGTAAGTTVLSGRPAFLSHINILNRPASGSIIFYDSNGTSTNTLGTYLIGTATNLDTPPTVWLKWRTNNGLTIVNTANVGLQAFYLP